MVFLGANDSCLPNTTGQYVPLDAFKQNLEKIITFSGLQTQEARIILVTVPPVDEYLLEIAHQERGLPYRSRTAENTKKYADASRETGIELGVAVLDLWSIIMLEAGWKDGQPLPGSKDLAKSEYLGSLLRDGKYIK